MGDEKKGWGQTVVGWFIEKDAAAGDETAEAPPAEEAVENPAVGTARVSARPPAAPVPNVFGKQPPGAPGGKVDFAGVFEAAGIDSAERERAQKAGELLASLPADTPLPARKQIVEASLKAFGVPIEKIIETGVAEIQALEGYIRTDQADTQKLIEESSKRITQYEQEIKNVRTIMEERVREQQGVQSTCNAKKLEVQRVLEFFGRDAVARVVRESPKLIDPTEKSGPAAKPQAGKA